MLNLILQNEFQWEKNYTRITNKTSLFTFIQPTLQKFSKSLTHSAPEYFEKLALKKTTKKRNFKRLYLKS